MYFPDPTYKYPLELRNHTVRNPRDGELLLDYINWDLYYKRKNDSIISVAEDIFKRIVNAKAQNTHLRVEQKSNETPILDRKCNTIYFEIEHAEIK